MVLHVTYCSRSKSDRKGKIPAVERYSSSRIRRIMEEAREKGDKFAILSGKYGLLSPDDRIPFYDKLLKENDLETMVPRVSRQLGKRDVSKVIYYTREIEDERVPYYRLIKQACGRESVKFEVQNI